MSFMFVQVLRLVTLFINAKQYRYLLSDIHTVCCTIFSFIVLPYCILKTAICLDAIAWFYKRKLLYTCQYSLDTNMYYDYSCLYSLDINMYYDYSCLYCLDINMNNDYTCLYSLWSTKKLKLYVNIRMIHTWKMNILVNTCLVIPRNEDSKLIQKLFNTVFLLSLFFLCP
jgi:hypothetical protein